MTEFVFLGTMHAREHEYIANQACSNLRLDQVVPLGSDVLEEPQDVDSTFVFNLLKHAVYDYVGARSAHSGTAGHRQKGFDKY